MKDACDIVDSVESDIRDVFGNIQNGLFMQILITMKTKILFKTLFYSPQLVAGNSYLY